MDFLKLVVLVFATAILFLVGAGAIVYTMALFSDEEIFWGMISLLVTCISIIGGLICFKRITSYPYP